ncbi:MAG: glycosyltransferase [Bacteroidetes bacterium]|nr:glycosyltransferase [Bacteroidota bacterium]
MKQQQSNLTPLVSVIIPVYNTEGTIKKAVESIVKQTYQHLEIILIDDASSDRSFQEIANLNDSRIRILRNETNLKTAATLNRGIAESNGTLIARMDADDVSHQDRIRLQVGFMQSHPDVDVLGTAFRKLPSGKKITQPLTHEEIDVAMLVRNPIAHPSVMIRKSLLGSDSLYNPDFPAAQDFELWQRLISKARFANLPDGLLDYYIHANQISTGQKDKQNRFADLVKLKHLSTLHSISDDETKTLYLRFINKDFQFTPAETREIGNLLVELIQKNRTIKRFDPVRFERLYGRLWFQLNQSVSSKTGWDASGFFLPVFSSGQSVHRSEYAKIRLNQFKSWIRNF